MESAVVQNDILASALLHSTSIFCAPLSNKEKASLNSIDANQYAQKESAKNRQRYVPAICSVESDNGG